MSSKDKNNFKIVSACPDLGPGWKKIEVFRQSGKCPGRSDIYYYSPEGKRVRSKPELCKIVGNNFDMETFDYRKGIFINSDTEKKILKHTKPKKEKGSNDENKKRIISNGVKTEVTTEQPNSRPTCPECGRSFMTMSSLGIHMLNHKSQDEYKCNECQEVFNREDLLQEHMECHAGTT